MNPTNLDLFIWVGIFVGAYLMGLIHGRATIRKKYNLPTEKD